MIEICRYIYENYPNLKNKIKFWQLLSLLDRNEDKIAIVKKNGKLTGVGMYVRISDETLWKIEYGFLDLTNPITMGELLKEDGDNIHFLFVLTDGYKTIMKGLKEVIRKENPKVISWFVENKNKFFKRSLKWDKVLLTS